jgi:hypothetical protein
MRSDLLSIRSCVSRVNLLLIPTKITMTAVFIRRGEGHAFMDVLLETHNVRSTPGGLG